jgi:mono/diheme cytochrome c family protein
MTTRDFDRESLAAWAAATLLATGLMWTPLAGAQENGARPSAEDLRKPEWIEAGRARFVKTCAYCHGFEGDAGKHVPFREHLDWDPAQIHAVITNGRQRGANVMPAWQGAISDDEIWRITAYILSLAGKPKAAN